MKRILKISLIAVIIVFLNSYVYANYNSQPNITIKGPITKVSVTNENESQPGFSICVKDATTKSEVCMWRKYNSFNYNQFLDTANMAVMSNKTVEIKSNMVGSLDSLSIINSN